MVDELVDFVFGAAAFVVFPLERLRNLYNQSINQVSQTNLKAKKKEDYLKSTQQERSSTPSTKL